MKNKDKSEKKKDSQRKWLLTVSLLSFILSIIFSSITTAVVDKLPIPLAIVILLLVIALGILFDMISMAVTTASEKDFHAKASRKIEGAKTSIKLIRDSAKVSSICADVIGDVCGILSGGIATIISLKITTKYNLSINLQVIISAIVASLTIGGKARFKTVAQENSTQIVSAFTKIINKFNFGKSEKLK